MESAQPARPHCLVMGYRASLVWIQEEIVNVMSMADTVSLLEMLTGIGDRMSRTRCLHASLCAALLQSSSQVSVVGASISRSPESPSCGELYMSRTASLTSLPLSIRRICPSHCRRRARIHRTRSNVFVSAEASSCWDLPVIIDIILLLAPFNLHRTSVVRRQASDPYVIIEQTHDLYRRSRRF